jgi:uncharacterized repeat protein (TIGR03803 family)
MVIGPDEIAPSCGLLALQKEEEDLMVSMKLSGRIIRLTCSLIFVLSSVLAAGTTASAQTVTTLASMTDGQYPWGSLVADPNGNLFGTTEQGGAGYGTVFEIAKTSSGYATPITLVSFDKTNGAYPFAGLIIDANGNLFGTAQQGGASQCSTVFEIARASTGYASTPTTLVDFDCTSGSGPEGGLIADANGNLFGTTSLGGPSWDGTVFEIVKTSSGYANTPTTLASFNGSNGEVLQAGLIADANGNLFGTANAGGANGYGVVFEIAKTASGYANSPTILFNFDNTNGAIPEAGLIADANGNLFGTTVAGGAQGYGVVFEIAKTSSGYASTPTILVNFDNTNGASPVANLIIDANGNLFGTTSEGGAAGYGTVFEILKTSSVYASTPTILASFNGSNGLFPPTGLIPDANGNLFGTTVWGGSANTGTVFEIAGSGFVPGVAPPVPPPPSNPFAGTPGSSNCIGKSTSALAHAYGGLAHAAPALGYASVSALQSAIANYCSN